MTARCYGVFGLGLRRCQPPAVDLHQADVMREALLFLIGDEAEKAAAGQKIFISPDRWEKTEREIYIK